MSTDKEFVLIYEGQEYELVEMPEATGFNPIPQVLIGGRLYYGKAKLKQQQLSKSKDWEVVSMIDGNGWVHPHNYQDTPCCTSCKIHSVRRLSDNEIFSIGDYLCGHERKIDKIFIRDDGELWLSTNKDFSYGCVLNVAQKVKKALLFTTEDGVDVYKDDNCWILDDEDDIMQWQLCCKEGMRNNYKYFSTKEAAEEYVLMNKNLLSVSNFIETLGQCATDKFLIEELKQLAKSKLDKK